MNLIGVYIVLVITVIFSGTGVMSKSISNDEENIPESLVNETSDESWSHFAGRLGGFVGDLVSPVSQLQESSNNEMAEEGRTFGLRRLQIMMLPLMYKMGVMMTLLVVLTVISLKGLAIGVMLLVLKLSALFGKLYASTGPQYYHQPPIQGWSGPQMPQPVHVHVHNSGPAPGSHSHNPYSGWESASAPGDDEHYYYKG